MPRPEANAGTSLSPQEFREPKQKRTRSGRVPGKSFKDGEADNMPKVESAIGGEGRAVANNRGGMINPNPQRPTHQLSVRSYHPRKAFTASLSASEKLAPTLDGKKTPLDPIMSKDPQKASSMLPGVHQGCTPLSNALHACSRSQYPPNSCSSETKDGTHLQTPGGRKLRFIEARQPTYQVTPTLPPTIPQSATPSATPAELAKSDKGTEPGEARTPTTTIWKEPLLPSTYSRDIKQKKGRALVKLPRAESVSTSPPSSIDDNEPRGPPPTQPRHRGISSGSGSPSSPEKQESTDENGRHLHPESLMHAAMAPWNERAPDDPEGWELNIASQILNNGSRWEHEPLGINSLDVTVTDSSILHLSEPTKGEAETAEVKDDDVLKRCWDEKWSWSQFEEAMGLQDWGYLPAPVVYHEERVVGEHPQLGLLCSEDKVIHPCIEVTPDAWQKSRLSCDVSLGQTQNPAPMSHPATLQLSTTAQQKAASVIPEPGADISVPLTFDEVTQLHSYHLHNDNVYWIDGISYAYSCPTQRTRSTPSGESSSPGLDAGTFDRSALVVDDGEGAAMQDSHTGGGFQPCSHVPHTKKGNLKTKKVILRIQPHDMPLTPDTPTELPGTNHIHEPQELIPDKAKSSPPMSPTYTEMLYSRPMPPMDWIVGDHSYAGVSADTECEGCSSPGAQMSEIDFTLGGDGGPASDFDIHSDQAWQLWVNTIGSVPSIQRAMGFLDRPIPILTEQPEQHNETLPQETPAIQGPEQHNDTLPQETPAIQGPENPMASSTSLQGMTQAQQPQPLVTLPSLNFVAGGVLHPLAIGYPLGQPPSLAPSNNGAVLPPDLEEGEIFEAQPPSPSFDNLFSSQLGTYGGDTHARPWKRRCLRPGQDVGERNSAEGGWGSPALANLAAQYADSDNEQLAWKTFGAPPHRHGSSGRG